MASVVLQTVGSAVGNAFLPGIGGALGGLAGGMLGGMIDNQLGLGTQATGPRLDNLAVQDSRYGSGIPIVYGNARIAGNVIWSTDLIETQHNSTVGGKGGMGGGVSETTYTYSVHCAVGICAGAIAGLNTIWADSNVIYQNGIWASGLFDGVSFYTGAVGQPPDTFMQSILGTGAVPAYPGLAYIVFDNLQLAAYGNRLPNLTFEIAATVAADNPVWLGSTDAHVSQLIQGVQGNSMPPLALSSNGIDVQNVLIGGYSVSGGNTMFRVAAYDVTQDVPVAGVGVSSASFSATSPVDCAWALAPDGRFVAMYMQNGAATTHHFVIYDSVSESFGAVYGANLAASSTIKQITWIDAQHFVIDDSSGGVRGLHVFARAGLNVLDLGFTAVWGAGSASSTALFYGAQFIPCADGILACTWVTAVSNVLTLQARLIAWRKNALSVGAAFTIASGLALGTGSGPHAQFVQTAAGEYTLFYSTVVDMRMLSFEPSASGATVTRAWQTIALDFGTGTTNFPVFFGDRMLVMQRAAAESVYRLSEIFLGDGSFTLSVDGVTVGGSSALEVYFGALRLDDARILLMGMGGFANDIGQLAIIQRNADGSIAAIVADILARSGYASGDYDVSALTDILIQGYVLQTPMSARSAIEPLQAYTPFDLVESAGQLQAVPRGGNAVAVVAAGEWRGAVEKKQTPPPLLITRAEEMDLPREVDVDAIDPSRNYEINSQRARRIATAARAVQKVMLPVVCDAGTVKQIAERLLYTAWAERDLVKLSVSRAWLVLDPSDVIDLGNGSSLRIASVTQRGGLVELEGYYSYAPVLSSAAQADGGVNAAITRNAPVPSMLYLLDLPLLQATDDQPGMYVAATGLAGWRGATLMRASDGVSYNAIASLSLAATAGIATTALGNGSGFYPDNANSVTVQVVQGELASCGWIDLTNGVNAALLGNEIIQFQTATLVGPGLYTLTNLLRGRRGTENAMATHSVGENFVLLQSGAVTFVPDKLSDRGRSYDFRAIASGQAISDASDTVFAYGMQSICPLAPATIKATRSLGTTGDVTVTWARRARLNAEWVDYIDVPLDEPQELYELDIMNGTVVMRAFTGLTAPTATYTAAQQATDWGGSIPAHFTINIYQISSRYGNGNAATAVV